MPTISKDPRYPEPTVGVLIVNTEGKIFLMTSPKWKGKYVIPGGHVEMGETLEEAVKREAKEETNLDVFDIHFVMFQEFLYGEEFFKPKHFIFFDFLCRTKDVNVVLNEEGTSYIWVTLEEAKQLPIPSATMAFISKVREEKIIQGSASL